MHLCCVEPRATESLSEGRTSFLETVEGGDLDGRVNRRSPEVPFFCSSFQEPEFVFKSATEQIHGYARRGGMNQIRLQIDSFIRPLLTRGRFGVGEGAVLLPPHSCYAFSSVLDSS